MGVGVSTGVGMGVAVSTGTGVGVSVGVAVGVSTGVGAAVLVDSSVGLGASSVACMVRSAAGWGLSSDESDVCVEHAPNVSATHSDTAKYQAIR